MERGVAKGKGRMGKIWECSENWLVLGGGGGNMSLPLVLFHVKNLSRNSALCVEENRCLLCDYPDHPEQINFYQRASGFAYLNLGLSPYSDLLLVEPWIDPKFCKFQWHMGQKSPVSKYYETLRIIYKTWHLAHGETDLCNKYLACICQVCVRHYARAFRLGKKKTFACPLEDLRV